MFSTGCIVVVFLEWYNVMLVDHHTRKFNYQYMLLWSAIQFSLTLACIAVLLCLVLVHLLLVYSTSKMCNFILEMILLQFNSLWLKFYSHIYYITRTFSIFIPKYLTISLYWLEILKTSSFTHSSHPIVLDECDHVLLLQAQLKQLIS